jgi:hypothetical protein
MTAAEHLREKGHPEVTPKDLSVMTVKAFASLRMTRAR